MKVRGVPVIALFEALAVYARRRLRPSPVAPLIAPAAGRNELTPVERRIGLGSDALLSRLGVRCLNRSAVVTQMLRRRGVAARIDVMVQDRDPRKAHAEVEVGGATLRPLAAESVPFR